MAHWAFLAMSLIKQSGEHLEGGRVGAVYFILLKLALVVALALLFPAYTTPLLSSCPQPDCYIAGLFVMEMRAVQSGTISPALGALLRGLYLCAAELLKIFDVMASRRTRSARFPRALIAQNTALQRRCIAPCAGCPAAAIFTRRNFEIEHVASTHRCWLLFWCWLRWRLAAADMASAHSWP